GTLLHSRYGYDYVTGAEATIAAGTADVSVVALLAGVAGNLPATETLSLVSPVDGVKATATLLGDGLTGGNDIEGYDTMRVRYLREVQEPVKGGTRLDYVTWALSFPGVTRAWAKSLAMGDGTVTVRFAMDNKYADGIPLAADATALYNYLEPLRPAGMSGLTVVPPTPAPLNPTIAIAPNTTAVQAAIEAQLRELLRDEAEPEEGTGKGRVLISHLRAVTSQAAGEADNAG
uniref:baseplate J/gp47 family protein n=1 Tax=Methylogaea oryzae TaxID=1295382 RepID=UPI00156BA357